MEAFRFAAPLWFAALPLVLLVLWRTQRRAARPAVLFSSVDGLRGLPVTLAQRAKRLLPWLWALGMALLIVALARPQRGRTEQRAHSEGIAIQMALDVSGSMEAIDFLLGDKSVNRLTAVKHVLRSFVLGDDKAGLPGRAHDLVGVVAFGGFADSKVPLTLDHGALVNIVEALKIPRPIRDRRGNIINNQTLNEELSTAIGDGLALSVERLRNVKAKSKVLILLTDGDSNAGVVEPLEAAKLAAQLGIRIYTIGAESGAARATG